MPRAAKGTPSEATKATAGSTAKASKGAAKATPATKSAPAKKAGQKAAPAKNGAAKKAAPAKKTADKAAPAKKSAEKAEREPVKKAASRASQSSASADEQGGDKQEPKMTAAAAKQAAKAAALAASPLAPVRSNAAVSSPLPSGLAVPAADATPAGKPKFTKQWLKDQRQKLIEARAEYEAQAAALKEEADAMVRDMEPGDTQFDEESGEGGTQAIDRERDLALAARAHAEIDEIDRALERLDRGTYGECERCGAPIPPERLEFIPEAPLCVSCKTGGLAVRR